MKITKFSTASFSFKEFHIAVIGDPKVGKTEFCSNLAKSENKKFKKPSKSKVGTELYPLRRKIENYFFRVELWDYIAKDKYEKYQTEHLSKVDGVIILFDTTNRDTYASVHDHCYVIRSFASEKCPIMILGNKIDLDKKRKVTREEAERLSFSKLALYREISAKKKQNIEQVLDGFIEALVENMQKENSIQQSANQSGFINQSITQKNDQTEYDDEDESKSQVLEDRLITNHEEEEIIQSPDTILKSEKVTAVTTAVEGEEKGACCSQTCNIF